MVYVIESKFQLRITSEMVFDKTFNLQQEFPLKLNGILSYTQWM